MPRSHAATVRSVRDRVVRAQRAYAMRLREAREALHPLLEEGDVRALDLAHAIDVKLGHITHGSAIVE